MIVQDEVWIVVEICRLVSQMSSWGLAKEVGDPILDHRCTQENIKWGL